MSDDDDENSAEAVVQRYMERVSHYHCIVLVVCYLVRYTQLNKQMGYQEIKEFASLLRQYREDNMHVTEFCTKLQELYGDDRKFLLPGKRSHGVTKYAYHFLARYEIIYPRRRQSGV